MPKYRVLAIWESSGVYHIEAANEDEARKIAADMPLPKDHGYVDDSFDIDSVEVEENQTVCVDDAGCEDCPHKEECNLEDDDGLDPLEDDCADCGPCQGKKYDNPDCNHFCCDMEAANLEVEHYHGRFLWEGPAVRVDKLQDALSHTKINCQWDNMGLGFIVYPKARGKKLEE